MHTKSELEEMSIEALTELAHSLNLSTKHNPEKIELIYNIIGAESESPALVTEKQPKKRGRKSKAEKEALEAAKGIQPTVKPSEEQPVAAEVETAMTATPSASSKEAANKSADAADKPADAPAPAPKKRGRKSKAEKAAMEAATREAEQTLFDVSDNLAEVTEMTPPAQPQDGGQDEAPAQPEMSDTSQNEDAYANPKDEPQPFSPEEVAAFFEADEPDFVIIKSVPDEPTRDYSGMQQQTAGPSFLQNLPDFHRPPVTSGKAATPATPDTQYDFGNLVKVDGVLEVAPDGWGFIRSSDYNYLSSPDDVFVSQQQIKQYGLKTGDVIEGSVRPPREGDKYYPLGTIDLVNGIDPARIRDRQAFEHLTPLFPDEKFNLCRGFNDPISVRIVDLFSPIGKGQRALIVAQPKTGKTILMKEIANAISANHPDAYLMMLLIDERPEEVTDMARTVNAEVIASTFDEPAERHVKIAGIVLEKAKRLVECGHDVVIFLDSITRLARAYNNVAPGSGKLLSGGVDANALQRPKRFFGAARNIEGGGSLTIIATALIDTGSKMDEVIFEEFKGTGNMELQLDRTLANKRIFPAVNIVASSTRRDDLLHDKTTLDRMWILRKFLSDMNPIEAMNELKGRIEGTKTNEEFLISMNS